MIANSLGANVIAIDISDQKLELAKSIGTTFTVNATKEKNLIEKIKSLSAGGVHVSVDALGSKETCQNSILNLRKRGKHIQIGLLAGDQANPPDSYGESDCRRIRNTW